MPLVVAEWDVTVKVEDQSQALAELRRAALASADPLVMIVVLGESLHPPEEDVRKRGIEMIKGALAIARALMVVVRGRGVLGTLQRSTARGVALMVPELRGRVHVHASLQEAVRHAGALLTADLSGLSPELARAGLPI